MGNASTLRCLRCEKEIREFDPVRFQYRGFSFIASGSRLYCFECARSRTKDAFDSLVKRFVVLDKGKVKVDWTRFLSEIAICPLNRATAMYEILRDIGVLSMEKKGNWTIIDGSGLFLGPKLNLFPLFFRKREDTIAFARIKYGETIYPWEIVQIGKSIGRREAIGENSS